MYNFCVPGTIQCILLPRHQRDKSMVQCRSFQHFNNSFLICGDLQQENAVSEIDAVYQLKSVPYRSTEWWSETNTCEQGFHQQQAYLKYQYLKYYFNLRLLMILNILIVNFIK